MTSITDRLAAALGSLLESTAAPGDGTQTELDRESARQALAAHYAHKAVTPSGEVKSNRAWREECQLLRARLAACEAPAEPCVGTTTEKLESPMLDGRETATVLAALRSWQEDLEEDGENVAQLGHFIDHTPLTEDEIDVLCERLNFPDEPATPQTYEAWPKANEDDPAEYRIDRDCGDGTAEIIAWVYTEADADMIADALNTKEAEGILAVAPPPPATRGELSHAIDLMRDVYMSKAQREAYERILAAALASAESRAEVGRLRAQVDVATEACWQQIQFQEQAQARAERLAEAVQEVVAHCSASSADGMGLDSRWIVERLRAALEQEA